MAKFLRRAAFLLSLHVEIDITARCHEMTLRGDDNIRRALKQLCPRFIHINRGDYMQYARRNVDAALNLPTSQGLIA